MSKRKLIKSIVMQSILFSGLFFLASFIYAAENYSDSSRLEKRIKPDVSVTTEKDRYTTQDWVVVIVRNNLPQDIWINACQSPFALWQNDGTHWVQHPPSLNSCLDATPRKIESHKEFKNAMDLDSGLFMDNNGLAAVPRSVKSKLEFRYALNSAEHLKGPLKSFSNEFEFLYEKKVDEACQRNDDCQIVESYEPPHGNTPGETIVECRNKNIPLKEGERTKEYDKYNEYIRGTCVCDQTLNKCRLKD